MVCISISGTPICNTVDHISADIFKQKEQSFQTLANDAQKPIKMLNYQMPDDFKSSSTNSCHHWRYPVFLIPVIIAKLKHNQNHLQLSDVRFGLAKIIWIASKLPKSKSKSPPIEGREVWFGKNHLESLQVAGGAGNVQRLADNRWLVAMRPIFIYILITQR